MDENVALVAPNKTTPIKANERRIQKNIIVNKIMSIYALEITSMIKANLLENPK
jgi:hypothetical protein